MYKSERHYKVITNCMEKRGSDDKKCSYSSQDATSSNFVSCNRTRCGCTLILPVNLISTN